MKDFILSQYAATMTTGIAAEPFRRIREGVGPEAFQASFSGAPGAVRILGPDGRRIEPAAVADPASGVILLSGQESGTVRSFIRLR